ncbi:MAG: hypothetical protein COU22_00710 [Candidatus Komeilibacteria bacterium CG10_big_fil_rev_8_21_14_0_10_41_13]|uniref:Type II secretion system protein GspF domain-containing protein n=1 Tax=Candidatus Komeilibacteria bacterium CG10_big_fil_rev_8_21_14_0_10_41_13 TaxID=1974476 RepID=A0A2M6WD50_9BACT|nr:MAG: hypothetical protein COU22_00710 [Candidatus Komeilibacteria bacterium CG10_big_fil_rev_8_21_14_0_10_41_13]
MVLDLENLKTSGERKPKAGRQKFYFLEKLGQIGTIPIKEKIFFVQNLQVMIKSGLALDKALSALAEQTANKRFKKIIKDMATSTEKGISFTDTLKKHEKVFGEMFVSMVKAGEISGRLEDVLQQIYIQIKKLHELKSKIISALTYPVVVIVAMIGIGIGMIIFVVPKITSLFAQVEAELPLATKILIGTSDFILNNGLLVGFLSIAIIFLIVFTLKHEKTKYYYHWFFLKMPVFGPIIKKINLAKFCRTLSSLIKTDIPIIKSFEITSQTLGNRLYRKFLYSSTDELKAGVTITEVLKKNPKLFPPVIVQMASAGEETGSVDSVLSELAQFYEDDIDQIMKTLPSIIEPILILVLGSGVALMAIAIIMPMQTLTQHIS